MENKQKSNVGNLTFTKMNKYVKLLHRTHAWRYENDKWEKDTLQWNASNR